MNPPSTGPLALISYLIAEVEESLFPLVEHLWKVIVVPSEHEVGQVPVLPPPEV